MGADAVRRLRHFGFSRRARRRGRAQSSPRGLSASALIEGAHLVRQRVGGAEVSDHDPNYVLIHPGATSRDVLRLIDLMRSRVQEAYNLVLEQEIAVW